MRPFTRSRAPTLLSRSTREVGEAFAQRRAVEPNARFSWRHSLYAAAREAVGRDTGEHCAYCDGFPIDSVGDEEVDHFKPKSRFPLLVCSWRNLFLSCTACNGEKGEQWHRDLLRADASDYSFERYFIFRRDTGELEANPAASAAEQRRARKTIFVLGLNRTGACKARLWSLAITDEDRPYRFLQR